MPTSAASAAPSGSSPLTPGQSADLLALAVRAAASDGVRPLSEQTVLDVRRSAGTGSAGPAQPASSADAPGTRHVLHPEPQTGPGVPERSGTVLGYVHVELGQPPSAELVVDPEHRGQGIGTELLTRLLREHPDVRVWAHGDLPAARALAARLDLRPVRDLWLMTRPLRGEWSDLPDVALPEGFSVRAFRRGQDEDRWLQVNARAFAHHAEQGRMTETDLAERLAEPWFDPSGFLLVEEDATGRLAAFHWTKVEPGEAGGTGSGEVYVLGVDPDYQGRGLGTATTVLGLRHLRACGLPTVTLYVDGDNAAAIATYHRLGFERSAVDVMYSA